MNINELNITNVEIDEVVSGKTYLFINFSLDNGIYYYMICRKKSGEWSPIAIHHFPYKNHSNKNDVCPFCPKSTKKEGSCDGLEKLVKELYEFFIHHPAIRLRLLFH